MPWCEDCAKYFAPSAMTQGGECPSCGRTLQASPASRPITAKNLNLRQLAAGDDPDASESDTKAPWHFKLLLVLMSLYFMWRIVDLFR